MGKRKGNWRNVNINLGWDEIDTADRILADMKVHPAYRLNPQLTRSYVLRIAIPRGLASLEAEIKGGKNE